MGRVTWAGVTMDGGAMWPMVMGRGEDIWANAIMLNELFEIAFRTRDASLADAKGMALGPTVLLRRLRPG
jgi:hypothetical protein